MADRPIIFSAPMVRALLEGRKTQTRRVYKVPAGSYVEQGRVWAMTDGCAFGDKALPYAPGDRLYVREHWRTARAYDDLAPSAMGGEEPVKYEADGSEQTWGWPGLFLPGRFRQGMHMPRWASRLTLTVTEVRVQRLQKISEEDAGAEGIEVWLGYHDEDVFKNYGAGLDFSGYGAAKDSFRTLWNSLHGPDAWDANPWVVAVTFTVDRRNIDSLSPNL